MQTQGRALKAVRRTGRSLMTSVFVFSIFVNLLMLVGPLFMLQVYDRVLASGSHETLLALFTLVAMLYGLMAILDFARGRLLARAGARFLEALNETVFRAGVRRAILPQERAAPATGLRDLETVQTTLSSPGFTALFDLPWSPIFFAALFIFHPLLGWLGLAGGAILLVLTLVNDLLTRQKLMDYQKQSGQDQTLAEQARRNMEVVQSQGMMSALSGRWMELRTGAQAKNLAYSDLAGFFTAFTKSFRLFLQSAMLAAGAWLVLQAELTAGAMIAGSILLGRALAPIEQSLGQWRQLQKCRVSWRSLQKLLSMTPPLPERTRLPRPAALVSLDGVTVRAPGATKPVLVNVSVQIQPGQALGVIGKSGAGKSSLVRTLTGLWPPLSGEIRLGGARLDQYEPDTLGTYIGYLPQDVVFFNGSVAQNIARMALEPDEQEIVRAAQVAEAHDLILSLADGYDTLIEGGPVQLSGGQRQRIALARALYGNPELLILDEPNSALDIEGAKALNQVVANMKELGKAVILTTHRPTAIGQMDRLLVLEDGAMAAEGPRDDVLKTMMGTLPANAQALKKRRPADVR